MQKDNLNLLFNKTFYILPDFIKYVILFIDRSVPATKQHMFEPKSKVCLVTLQGCCTSLIWLQSYCI